MSMFNYSSYQDSRAAAQSANSAPSVKVAWFKLANDQDEALVRFNVSSLDDLQFGTVHQLGANTNWMKVSCLNEIGSFENKCPLCAAVEAGDTSIGKVSKKVYVQMLAAYKDRITGQWAAAIPVIWEKPAGFSRELATAIKDYGDLRQVMFKVTRNGAKGDMKTTYAMSIILPTNPVITPNMIPVDFSAFNNFRLDKHSFWVKTAEEINTFLETGKFPEVVKNLDNSESAPAVANVASQYAMPAASVVAEPVAPVYQAPQPQYNVPYTPPTMMQPQPAPVYPQQQVPQYTAPQPINPAAAMTNKYTF